MKLHGDSWSGVTVEKILDDIKIGWNLGNSLDSIGVRDDESSVLSYETSWGNPKTTKQLIDKVIQSGFNLIRIPVTWQGRFSRDRDYSIAVEWLDRVQEVVDYAYEEGVYVIVDTHHEDEWLGLGDDARENEALTIMNRLWTQIADRFKHYGPRLIFETMNETRLIGTEEEWTAGTVKARKIINKLNASAVNAIRKTGANNEKRAIIIPTYGAKASAEAIDDIVVPNNDAMIILAVHAYAPYFFCMVPEETAQWGSPDDVAELEQLFDSICASSKAKGLPLIIGEFGTINKNNEKERAIYSAYYVKEAKKRGIKCVLWDNDISTAFVPHSFAQLDRKELRWRYPDILKALMENS